MIEYITVRPWNLWPGEKSDSTRDAPFRATFAKTTRLLERELSQLDATDVVLELAITESDLRRDGWIKENARPWTAGVILSFTSKITGPVRYPCDAFFDWQDNVRAIALGLEALRKVDRYGITRRGEQYTGWKALPASTAATMTTGVAANVIASMSEDAPSAIVSSHDVARAAARIAKHRSHPDRNNGDHSSWDNVQAAIAVLTSHHGVSL